MGRYFRTRNWFYRDRTNRIWKYYSSSNDQCFYRWTNGKIYELTFQNSYSTPPTVITNFYSEQGISYYGFVATQVVALSNTKCTLCVFVQGLTGSKCGISYMVKGK